MPIPPLTEETTSISDRITALEEAGVTAEELQQRVLELRIKAPQDLSDQELIDACACTALHRRTTSGPPKTKSATKKLDPNSLLEGF